MGMWVFLCSEVMFFTGPDRVLHRAAVRHAALAGPGVGPEHPADGRRTPFILICSSVTMVRPSAAVSRGDIRKLNSSFA